MAGKTISPAAFRYEQTVASDTWIITHNLGGNGGKGLPLVDIFIPNGLVMSKIIPLYVSRSDLNVNEVIVGFSQPRTGIAIIVA